MNTDGAQRLAEAARQRSESATRRAQQAIRTLDRAGQPINFTAVAQAASVSRGWLYRVPTLRTEIERLRSLRSRASRPLPINQRSSDASNRQRIETLLDANRALRAENRRLNQQIALLLGDRRDPAHPPS